MSCKLGRPTRPPPLSSPVSRAGESARALLLSPSDPPSPGQLVTAPTSQHCHWRGPSRSCCRAHRTAEAMKEESQQSRPRCGPPGSTSATSQHAQAHTGYHLVKAGLGLWVPQQRFGCEDDQLEGKCAWLPAAPTRPGLPTFGPGTTTVTNQEGSSPACGRAAGSACAARGSSWPVWNS